MAVTQVNLIASELVNWMEAFLFDSHSTRLSKNTIDYYRYALTNFLLFCTLMGVKKVDDLDANTIRRYLLSLENQGYNAGGVHAKWRAVRAFLNWYAEETNWTVPKIKVRAPKDPPLNPADPTAVKAILKDCAVPVPFHADWLGVRDKAIILLLLDTGLRASELLSVTLDNLDIIKGEIQVCGKGGKWRTVFFGKTTRRALRAYMGKQEAHIFLNEKGDALTRSGLMAMLKRRAKRAGVKYQSAHSFRRLFAITMLRAGVDVYSLKILMGHESEQVLRRYLKLTQQDTREAHIKGSPVEKLI